ncbi:MAG TPA: F0F1 ATP synthase subunit delta [Smithellaceae bacterium]|nr:F0F1 ATP synthase subunit delta [Smithellaceae bacterium]HRS89523.1 F0F1 ATP synthase subunit delta [Smithellaceae bacterium]HRV26473.1 F0F1 ATP synthase subunit delta [Smithellaceae bacterium]
MHIDWFVLGCQIFNFLLLVYLLKRFLYGRILKAMDDREAKIAARFSEAREIKEKAAEAAELYEKRNRQLAEKSEQMLNEASLAAEIRRKELMEKVREEVDAIKIRWQTMLAREKEAFFQDLRGRAAREIYATARKALADLGNADLEAQIVAEFIRRVQGLDSEKSKEIRKAITGGGNKVVVQSAFDISPDTQAKIEQALKKQISNGFTVRYMKQPDVVSGIELRVNGHKIAWSLNEYLETLVENLTEVIQKEAHAA